MGYWQGNAVEHDPNGLVWGDKPADIMDLAVEKIVEAFTEDLDRLPTKAELREGLEFHLRAREDLQDN